MSMVDPYNIPNRTYLSKASIFPPDCQMIIEEIVLIKESVHGNACSTTLH